MRVAGLILCLMLTACSQPSSDGVFTLYRNSPLDANMRIHVASFDADDGKDYNQENCRIAADLFGAQPGVVARYWCEMGRFRN